MKNSILILLLLFSMITFSQEVRKKCVTVEEKKLPNYKVKVIKTNHCVEPKEINVEVYIITEWEKKKRKQRKLRKNDK
tara:strand:+ start:4147 stop:4380 length:234 start_codon:yes stop_codon:yes gene_type:complete